MKTPISLLTAAMLTLTAIQPAAAHTQAERPTLPERAQQIIEKPIMSLRKKERGRKALRMLRQSGKLPNFAKFYGMKDKQVERLFKTDHAAHLDETGALMFVEPMPTLAELALAEPNSGANRPTIPLSETFQLQSKPGSTKTLFLDFDGHTFSGTAWNSSYGAGTINHYF